MRNASHNNTAGIVMKHSVPTTLRQQQLDFAAAIRHPPSHAVVAGVATERMAVYRDLFFNNFIDTLSSAFPVLHKVIPETQWLTLCEQFFANHQCQTPYLARLPYEFLTWLQQHPVNDPPWFMELAQWEWTELDLFLAPDADIASTTDDVINGVAMLSPLTRLHTFEYAVHQISVDFLPDAPSQQAVHLLAWRRANDDIGFMQLNALSARLCELITDNKHYTGHELLKRVAGEFSEFDPALIMQGGADALQSFSNNSIVFLKHPQKDNA